MGSVCVYVVALTIIALDGRVHGPSLASSPGGVADGGLMPLLTSGLVVDGAAWPQIALVAIVLLAAVRRLGAVRLWAAALAAHVGGTLAAYAGIGLLSIVEPRLTREVVHAPDYGVSVVLTGELGALAAWSRRRALIVAGPLILAVSGIAAAIVAGTVNPFVLANAEHPAGFGLGALAVRLRAADARASGARWESR